MNLTRCEGYAQCAFLAPAVFRMRGAEALVYDAEPDDAQRDRVLRAAAACPVQAILIDGIGNREAAAPAMLSAATSPGPARPSGSVASARRTAAIEAFRRDGRIVIVGASLAGLRAAAVLRREGFAGSLTMIGDEPYAPYDRPALSKQVLDGGYRRTTPACRCASSSPRSGGWACPPAGWICPPSRSAWPTATRLSSTGC
ncbi:ferredoxin [Dactylosporangium darangshiense]|uniref:ferredoxin n=1 Tax=Dactylosporangium darangshiense TaxID=579108 RepID=UPI00363F7390